MLSDFSVFSYITADMFNVVQQRCSPDGFYFVFAFSLFLAEIAAEKGERLRSLARPARSHAGDDPRAVRRVGKHSGVTEELLSVYDIGLRNMCTETPFDGCLLMRQLF